MTKNILTLLYLFVSVALSQNNPEQKKTLDSLQSDIHKYASLKDSANLALAHYSLGKYYDQEEKYEESIKTLLTAIKIAESSKEIRIAGRIYNYLASIYSQIGEREKSIRTYEKSYKDFEKLGITKNMAAILLNMGTEFVTMGNLKKAIEYEIKALELKEASKDSAELAFYHVSVADLFFTIKDYSKWAQYLLSAKKLAEVPAYTSFTTNAKILNELGEYYRRKGDINKTIATFENLYEMCAKEEYLNGMSTALSNLSQIYITKGDFKRAEATTRKALQLNKQIERASGIIYDLNQLGSLNRVLKNYQAAKSFLLEAVQLAKKHKNNEELIRSYDELYQVSKNMGSSTEALRYLELHSAQKDSMLNLETSKQISELEKKYETEKKEARIKLLQKENEIHKIELTRRNITIAGILLFAILLTTLGYSLYKQKKTKAEIIAIQAEHKMLRSQMNPHFIFNSLMAIQNYLLKNDSTKTADYLSEFASLMRLILAGSRSDKITLADEIAITEYYLNLQKMRFNDKFVFDINKDEQLDTKAITIPPMLIQPFIENAVEHGIRTLENGKGKITVSFEQNESGLQIEVRDNGKGISSNSVEKRQEHESYATQITKERIDAINKMYKAKIDFKIVDLSKTEDSQGTSVKFVFPNSLINSGKA